jgi:hypothetical protein
VTELGNHPKSPYCSLDISIGPDQFLTLESTVIGS